MKFPLSLCCHLVSGQASCSSDQQLLSFGGPASQSSSGMHPLVHMLNSGLTAVAWKLNNGWLSTDTKVKQSMVGEPKYVCNFFSFFFPANHRRLRNRFPGQGCVCVCVPFCSYSQADARFDARSQQVGFCILYRQSPRTRIRNLVFI